MNLGLPELIVISIVIIILFGSRHLPDVGREMGELFSGLNKIKLEIEAAANDIALEVKSDETLTIFLSSVMNPKVEDLREEREAIKAILNHERLFSLWRFEDAPADDELEASYLTKVEECHLFLIVIGAKLSEAVKKEFETARKFGKPILVFIKTECDHDIEVESFIASLTEAGLRYKTFSSLKELQKETLRAVYHCVVKYYVHSLTKKTYLSCLLILKLLDEDNDLESVLSKFNGSARITPTEEQKLGIFEKRTFSQDSQDEVLSVEDILDAQWDEAYFRESDYQKALSLAREQVKVNPTPWNYLQLSWTYDSLGRTKDAISTAYKGYNKLNNKLSLSSFEKWERNIILNWIKEFLRSENNSKTTELRKRF